MAELTAQEQALFQPITLDQLTTATKDGTGVLDVLLRAARVQLDEQYTKDRIKGAEYAQVYLGAFQTILQNATTFLLQRQQSNQEALLRKTQVDLASAQVLIANAELTLANAKIEQAALEKQILEQQVCKLKLEVDILGLTKTKTDAEVLLLQQRVLTEKAQISALGVDDHSVVGRQKLLYQAQTDGFKRDAEQKVAKQMLDTWSLRRTTDDTGTQANTDNKLTDSMIGRAVGKMLEGVGIASS